jgi:hypothetical protein
MRTLIKTGEGSTRSSGSFRCPFCIPALVVLAGSLLFRPPLSALEYEKGSFAGSLNGAIEASGVIPFNGETPRENPSALVVLEPRADFGEHVSFYADLRGGYEGSQRSPNNDGVLIRFDEVYPSKDRYLEIAEAYLSFYLAELDLRVGIQKFAWGTLDQFNPTDNLNPWDLRHPFTTDPLRRKIGVPAVRALFGSAFSSVLVEAIWMPFYVPYRMPDPGDRWYPPLFGAVKSYPTPDLGLPIELPPVNIVQVNTEPDLPSRTFENSDFGIRISRTIGNADISVSYFYGFDRMPVFGVEGAIVADLQFLPPDLDLTYLMNLRPQLHRIQVFGVDMAMSRGAFTFRAEGAFVKDRHINVGLEAIPEIADDFELPPLSEIDISGRPNGLTVSFPFSPQIAFPKNLLSIGGGIDYQWGTHLLTFQMVGNSILNYGGEPLILNYGGEPLIYKEFELLMILGVNSRFLEDTLLVEGGLVLNPSSEFWMISIEPKYLITDAWTVGTRLLLLEGDRNTYLGQYSRNDEISFYIRYAF